MLVAGFATRAEATSVTFTFDCILDNATTCTPASGSFGTLVLSDSPGNGDLLLTVTLAGTEKFRDLMLNYTGGAAQITEGGTENLLQSNHFQLPPYTGFFDVGSDGQQGWNTTSPTPFITTLYGWNAGGGLAAATAGPNNVNLTLADFQVLDSLNQIYAALHIQDLDCGLSPCPPGFNESSIKVGAHLTGVVTQFDISAPEPASLVLLGSGLLAGALRLRRRKHTA